MALSETKNALSHVNNPMYDQKSYVRHSLLLSETILLLAFLTLTLTSSSLAGEADVFYLDSIAYPDTPNATVLTHSQLGCSIQCLAEENWRCGGFKYFPNGTCQLFGDRVISICTTPESSGIYPTVFARTNCPG